MVAALAAGLVLVTAGAFAAIRDQWRRAEAALSEAEVSDSQTQQVLDEILQTTPSLPLRLDSVSRAPSVESLRKAEAHSEHALGLRPGDRGVRIALTKVRGGLATVYLVRGQTAEADACLRAARDLWELLVRQDPHDAEATHWLANTTCWEAHAAQTQGDYARALQSFEQTHVLWTELAERQPGDVDLEQQRFESYFALLGLISIHPGREEAAPLLEDDRVRLTRLVQDAPSDIMLRRRLALICFLLGEIHLGDQHGAKAVSYWQQAYDHYVALLRGRPGDFLVTVSLGRCCYRLMRPNPLDPYYREAVACYEREGTRLAGIVSQHPDADWVRQALLENYCSLALCHWRAGQTARGQQVIQEQVRPLSEQAGANPKRPTRDVGLLRTLIYLSGALREANQYPAAQALAREAGILADRYVEVPWPDRWFRGWLVTNSIFLATVLRQVGVPADALRHAERSRRLSQDLCRTEPENLGYLAELSETWTQIGKARWDLRQADGAIAAFREAIAVQRQVVDRAPSVRANRLSLSRCYDRLFSTSRQAAHWKDAAAALLEREKLWPDDVPELKRIATDFRMLAKAMEGGKRPLSPEEQVERQRYLDESRRAMQAAEGVASRSRPQ
jgi:tetratricopeptide (TPR) repeat protein